MSDDDFGKALELIDGVTSIFGDDALQHLLLITCVEVSGDQAQDPDAIVAYFTVTSEDTSTLKVPMTHLGFSLLREVPCQKRHPNRIDLQHLDIVKNLLFFSFDR